MPLAVTESTFLIVTSLVMSSFVIANAYYQKNQFYPSVVYITKSNASMAIIYVQGLVLVLLLGKLMRKIFFGQLRTAEMEHLIERSWYAVTETCLAFTVFRDDLSPKFVALFTLLLFLKCFHWLAEDRVDYMERSPNISVLFHVRVVSLLAILGLLDITFVYMAYHSTLTKGASVQLVFGFEYAILFAIIINISMKYILHFFDLYNENPWEDKAIYLLYTELIMGLLKICLYFIFIVIMMKIHTFPLFAIRPMYLTMRGFKKALNDVIMSRRAIHHMNTLYPDATPQDIENSDNVCIICRENMVGNGSCKKLPCNHIFHVTCLRSWFQRQQTCPTCRMDVLGASSQRPGNANDAVANNNNNNNNQVANNNNNPNGLGHVPPIPPMFPAHPMMFQHFQNLFQRQNNQQNGPNNENNNNGPNAANPGNQGAGAAAAAAAAAAGSSGSANAPAGSGFVPPPPMTIPIPPPVFANAFYSNMQSPPFPMPQLPIEALLQGFSDQELRVLEGSERQNIEARIKCLMDVKTLINAATFRLQQYNNVLINSQSNASASTQTDAALFEPPTSNASRNSSSPVNVDSVPSTSVGNSGDQNDDKEMIRQRRLQRFTQAADNSESSSSVMPDTTAQNEN